MNEVKRYKLAAECGVAGHMESLSGKWVKYEDYAALQQQLTATTNSLTNAQEALKSAGIQADTVQEGVMELVSRMNQMVAEMSVVEAIHDECVFITDDDYDACPKSVQKIIRNLAVMKIPATEAYLNAVRAEGVDSLASLAGQNYQYHSKNREQQKKWKNVVLLCVQFAAQLRSGNAGKDGVCD